MMSLLPKVNQAYYLVNQEDSQREMCIGVNNLNAMAFYYNSKNEEKNSPAFSRRVIWNLGIVIFVDI